MNRLCRDVTASAERRSTLTLESFLRYIASVVEVAANPTNPAGWFKVLLDKPVEALVAWYRRRPIATLLDAGKDVAAMRDYTRLLTKHFDADAAARAAALQSPTS